MNLKRVSFGLLLLGTLSACGYIKPIKPWVKPYERQNIADPIMSFSRDPISDSYLSHVRDAREGASGADGGAGGGCGCN
ncbi:MAG: DUF4266 domain-containing protein [Pseudomonadota bacterium]